MRVDDLFEVDPSPLAGPDRHFRHDFVAQLRVGPIASLADADIAVPLARLVHDELQGYGTNGVCELTEQGMRTALSALLVTIDRLGIRDFNLPFRDFPTFRGHWIKEGAKGSWQARRDLLNELFDPLHDQLAAVQVRALKSTLAQPVTSHSRTGWPLVDEEIGELRRHFRNARTIQDYRAVGNDCAQVMEALSAIAYDPQIHLRGGETEPPVQQTKNRLDRVIEVGWVGPGDADLRKLARASIEVAQKVKHSSTPSAQEAGIAADAVILVANMFRRLRN
jgi:hypothetical protein